MTPNIINKALLNSIRTLSFIIFPLLTYPYVSRILLVKNLGKCYFADNVMTYVSLLAGLGISTYAIREGVILREKSDKLQEFSNEIFTLNMISTACAYILLGLLLTISAFKQYRFLIVVYCSVVLFQTLSTEWLLAIREDYFFMAIKSVVLQLIAMVFIFIFIKSESDYYIYAIIMVCECILSYYLSHLYVNRFCRIHFDIKSSWQKHLKPVLRLFAGTLAVTVYCNTDILMLGLFTSDYFVGIYSFPVKIYTMMKSLFSALLFVTIPRMTDILHNKGAEDYDLQISDILDSMITILFPAVTGLIIIGKQIIRLLAGEAFVPGTMSLQLLSIALLFCVLSTVLQNCVMIPQKLDSQIVKAALISAVINVCLNLILIPLWQERAAACTTLISEITVLIFSCYYSKHCFHYHFSRRTVISVLTGCIGVIIVCKGVALLSYPVLAEIILSLVCSGTIYCILLLLLRNRFMINIVRIIMGKLKLHNNKLN